MFIAGNTPVQIWVMAQLLPITCFPDFPGYDVGDDGSVGSYKHFTGVAGVYEIGPVRKLLKWRWINGYPAVKLSQDRRAVYLMVHRLVLETFVGPCPPGLEARHLDGDRSNPALFDRQGMVRLAWGTPLENAADRETHGTQLFGSRIHNHKLVESQVPQVRSMLRAGMGPSEIGRLFGVAANTICDLAAGRTWKRVV